MSRDAAARDLHPHGRSALAAGFLAFVAAAGYGAGVVADRSGLFSGPDEAPAGRWMRRSPRLTPPAGRLDQLLAVPYLQGYRQASAARGVTIHDETRASPGLNLYLSAHAPEAILIDMQGTVRHRWSYAPDRAFPGAPRTAGAAYWRRAHLFENGDLIAMCDDLGLVKLDRDSRALWVWRGEPHHDLFVTEEGDIHVLTRETRLLPRINADEPVLEDSLTVLDRDGRFLRRLSLLESFERSPYAPLLDRMKTSRDLFHTNTVTVFDGRLAPRSPLFRKGNVLLSMRELDTVAILDPEAGRIVWALRGMFRKQHEPVLLDGGSLLLFDNRGLGDRSRALEIDFFSKQVAWQYDGGADHPFSSPRCCGTLQRLPNGDTLIVESEAGRAFEVTRAGEVVWEFVSPHRTGESGELVATLFDLVRFPPGFAFPMDEERAPS
jgi:hypothetical protein